MLLVLGDGLMDKFAYRTTEITAGAGSGLHLCHVRNGMNLESGVNRHPCFRVDTWHVLFQRFDESDRVLVQYVEFLSRV